jgi:hypothetical protein
MWSYREALYREQGLVILLSDRETLLDLKILLDQILKMRGSG